MATSGLGTAASSDAVPAARRKCNDHHARRPWHHPALVTKGVRADRTSGACGAFSGPVAEHEARSRLWSRTQKQRRPDADSPRIFRGAKQSFHGIFLIENFFVQMILAK